MVYPVYVVATLSPPAIIPQRGLNQRISRRTMSKAILGAMLPVARKNKTINTLVQRSTNSSRPNFERLLNKIAKCRNKSTSAQNAMNAVALVHAATGKAYLSSNKRKNLIVQAMLKVKYC